VKQTSKTNALLSDDAEYWRKLAEAARSKADRINNPRSKQTMLKVADTYERKADQPENKKPWGIFPAHKLMPQYVRRWRSRSLVRFSDRNPDLIARG
jgi:hypothetical protein